MVLTKNQKNLSNWITHISNVHAKDIDLSLDRIKIVAKKLGITSFSCPVITVTGTNGKGSCIAFLEQIYSSQNLTTCVFLSPFLFRFNEQIRINKKEVGDELLCSAFAEIESKRGDIPLTAFEFTTLAALKIFQQTNPDIVLLEVGMGGKTDAVNIVDPNIAIITNIDIEHASWLGNTREEIAIVKAGICRPKIPVICGDKNPPQVLFNYIKKIGGNLFLLNKNFFYQENKNSWLWHCQNRTFTGLPIPRLAIENSAIALMAVELLKNDLPIAETNLYSAIANANLPGRFQILEKPVTQIFDVAHNPAAAKFLSNQLEKDQKYNKTIAVFSMLADKDIVKTVSYLKDIIDEWHIAPLKIARAAKIEQIIETLQNAGIKNFKQYPSIESAYKNTLEKAKTNDRIVVFGSFYTIAEANKLINNN